tara:strand:- start:744 stop:1388 length:645 start_codon:yes stop_codon:yes gene_type:complete
VIFTNKNPSKQYLQLIQDYQEIHTKGTKNKSAQDTYNGLSTINFAEIIKKIINKNQCKTLLDYGSGKGDRYFNKSFLNEKEYPPLSDFWNINPTFFDPGVPFPKPNFNKSFDITISIDVLEHIPQQDLGWVIKEIFEFSNNIIFINVACYDAYAKLPNGKNAHVSVFNPWWWHGFISSIACNYEKKVFVCCSYKEKNQNKIFNFSINDDFKNYI